MYEKAFGAIRTRPELCRFLEVPHGHRRGHGQEFAYRGDSAERKGVFQQSHFSAKIFEIRFGGNSRSHWY